MFIHFAWHFFIISTWSGKLIRIIYWFRIHEQTHTFFSSFHHSKKIILPLWKILTWNWETNIKWLTCFHTCIIYFNFIQKIGRRKIFSEIFFQNFKFNFQVFINFFFINILHQSMRWLIIINYDKISTVKFIDAKYFVNISLKLF